MADGDAGRRTGSGRRGGARPTIPTGPRAGRTSSRHEPEPEAWEAPPVTNDQKRNGIYVIPPERRPRVVLRWADASDLLVSGLLDGGAEIAEHPAVVDVPAGKGHVVLFSNNPVWRGETHGSSFLVFNALLNFDSLDAGRQSAAK